jgi:uracil-DNA glycosylase
LRPKSARRFVTTFTGDVRCRVSGIRALACWWSDWPPQRTAPIAPAVAGEDAAGFANQTVCERPGDGLALTDAYVLSAARCAPPGNRPQPSELRNCRLHLDREFDALPEVRVLVALGRIAWDAVLGQLARRGDPLTPRPRFAHGALYHSASGLYALAAYHPSRQNTHTGRLTPQMLADVFRNARELVG